MMDRPMRKIEIVDERVARILREKTPAERLAIADGMWHFAWEMIRANIAREHPDWPDEEVRRQTARRISHGAF